MKMQELRHLSKEELLLKEKSIKEELHKLNLQRYSGRVDKPHVFSLLRKDIARIKTILNQKIAVKTAPLDKTGDKING